MKHVRPFFGLPLILCGKMNARDREDLFWFSHAFPHPPHNTFPHYRTSLHIYSHRSLHFSPPPDLPTHLPSLPHSSPHLATLSAQHLPSLPFTALHTSPNPCTSSSTSFRISSTPPYTPILLPTSPLTYPTAHISPHNSLTSPHTLLPPTPLPTSPSPPFTHPPLLSSPTPHLNTLPTPLLTSPTSQHTSPHFSSPPPHNSTHLHSHFLSPAPHPKTHPHTFPSPPAPQHISLATICLFAHLLQTAHFSKCLFVPMLIDKCQTKSFGKYETSASGYNKISK